MGIAIGDGVEEEEEVEEEGMRRVMFWVYGSKAMLAVFFFSLSSSWPVMLMLSIWCLVWYKW